MRGRPGVSTATLLLLVGLAFIMYVDRSNISVAAPVIQRELGFSNARLGSIFSAFATAYACFMLAGGWLADRVGARVALTVYGTLWALATIASGLAGSLASLVAARFAVGVGESAVYPTAARLISRWVPDNRRGTAQGTVHAAGRVGNAAAPAIVTALIVVASWRAAFLILGGVTLLYVALMFVMLRDDPRQHPRITAAELERLGHGHAGPPARNAPLQWANFLHRVWPATAVAFCHGWMLWFFLNWIPSYFARAQGMALEKSAVFTTLVLLGGVAGTACGGLLTDWWYRRTGDRLRGRRDVIVFAFIASGLALLPLLFTGALLVSSISLAVAFFLSELGDAPLWMVAAEVEPGHAATSAAATFTGMAAAGAVSPLVVGWLLDLTGGSWVAPIGASVFVLALGPFFAARVRLAHQPAISVPAAVPV